MFQEIERKLADYSVVLEPDEDRPEWWAGAPSVARGSDGTFYLAARMREGNSPKGKRGYEIRILKSSDGIQFEKVHSIKREEAGVSGFERPALVIDPKSGQYKLYCCSFLDRGWEVLKFEDADSPEAFDPGSAKTVLVAEYPDDDLIHVKGYKDPVLYWIDDHWLMFVTGYDRVERTYVFKSLDGIRWDPFHPRPFLENTGWHNLYTRPASVLPFPVGYLFVYEGSNVDWRDPNYNIATGLAYSPDLKTTYDLTPGSPLLMSTTPGGYHTWRYSHWMYVGDRVHVYFEAARPNGTNELRLGILDWEADVGFGRRP